MYARHSILFYITLILRQPISSTINKLTIQLFCHVRQKQLSAISAHVITCPQFTTSFQEFRDENHLANVPSSLKKYIGRYFEKLKFTNGFHERRFMESLLINQHSPNLNSQVNSKPLEILF